MGLVKNATYRKFLSKQIISTITLTEFLPLLEKISYPRNQKEARALVILLWMSACRPNEALQLKRSSIQVRKNNLLIDLPGSKGSEARTIVLPRNNPLVKEFWSYVSVRFPDMLLFPDFYSKSVRAGTTIKLRKWKEKGTNIEHIGKRYEKAYPTISAKLIHYFNNWFGFPPYVFRHNRMTIAAERLNLEQLRKLKGAKTEASVMPYLHLTMKEAQKISRELVK